MLSKEEYKERYFELSQRFFSLFDFLDDDVTEQEIENIGLYNMLIDEHFEPKENTSEFKHFKLHSDSTLKNQTKKELIDYIKMLYHNWEACDEQLKNCIDANTKLKGKYSKILDDVHDYRFETHCMKMTIRNLCEHFGVKSEKELQNIYLNKPYKFEDLKPNMWVWDDIEKLICQIRLISKNAIHRKYIDGTISDSPFEENRFFPVQCANLES